MAKIPATVALTVSDDAQPRAQAVSLLRQLAIAVKAGERVTMDGEQIEQLDALIVKLALTMPASHKREFVHEATCPGGVFCTCPGAPNPNRSRAKPSRTGKVGVEVTINDETTRFDSASSAARFLGEQYETAESCRAYIALVEKKQSANARLYLMRDVDAGRLPDVQVEFDS